MLSKEKYMELETIIMGVFWVLAFIGGILAIGKFDYKRKNIEKNLK